MSKNQTNNPGVVQTKYQPQISMLPETTVECNIGNIMESFSFQVLLCRKN